MKLYYFDKKKLDYSEVSLFRFYTKIFLVFTIIFVVISSFYYGKVNYFKTEDRIIILEDTNSFSEEKLKELIYSLNFRFPEIVFAQAKLESGNFKSSMFIENNNLFGMKEPKVRVNMAKGGNKGHAYYDNWQSSVIDYALYYSTYLYRIKTKEEYYEYLRQNYAEDSNYVNKLKSYKLN